MLIIFLANLRADIKCEEGATHLAFSAQLGRRPIVADPSGPPTRRSRARWPFRRLLSRAHAHASLLFRPPLRSRLTPSPPPRSSPGPGSFSAALRRQPGSGEHPLSPASPVRPLSPLRLPRCVLARPSRSASGCSQTRCSELWISLAASRDFSFGRCSFRGGLFRGGSSGSWCGTI